MKFSTSLKSTLNLMHENKEVYLKNCYLFDFETGQELINAISLKGEVEQLNK